MSVESTKVTTVARKPGRERPARGAGSIDARARWLTAALFAAFILLWELLADIGLVDPKSASRPTAVLGALGALFTGSDGGAAQAIGDTAYVLLVAFLISVVIGLPLGLAVALNSTIRAAYLPIVMYLLGMPKAVFLPLFVLFFGLGNGSAIAFGVVLACLQIAVNIVGGIDSVEHRFFNVADAFGASAWDRFWHVILPGAAPGIFAGLWHGIRNAFVGILIAQMFVSNVGIGYLVKLDINNLRIDDAMALIVLAAAAVIIVGSLWELGERRITRWRSALRR